MVNLPARIAERDGIIAQQGVMENFFDITDPAY
jgi:hypothetical protein